MKNFIIDLSHIKASDNYNNRSYYIHNRLIPMNSVYQLYMKPYHNNEKYVYRDFYTEQGFKNILASKIENKPISNKSYNIGRYYNPKKPRGEIQKYEILVEKTEKYNDINCGFTIKEIYTFSKNITQSIYKSLYIRLGGVNCSKKSIINIKFIVDDVLDNNDSYFIRWVPINVQNILYVNYFEIDITDFIDTIDLKNINKNIMIVCKKN